ncbi:MAG: tol-pal system protein YbgF [Deltaproteobacteria bacterium]|nr:tol-pal system protein YbgF [Deltaproteobacteria bacterium]
MRLCVPALAVFALLLLGGCTASLGGGGGSSLQREVDALRRDVDVLKNQNRLGELRGGPETAAFRADLERLSADTRQQLAELDARLERLEQRAGLPPAPKQPPPSRPAAPPPAPAPEPVGFYDEGKHLFDRQDYSEAVERFRSYLREEPKGTNAAAAQFYIGESLHAERRFEEAILEYQKVVQGFPKSSQVPTSLLKQGLSFQSLGDGGSAKLLYQKVVNNYPKSYAAGVARERLKSL